MLVDHSAVTIHRSYQRESIIDWNRTKVQNLSSIGSKHSLSAIKMPTHLRCDKGFGISSDDTNGIRSFNSEQGYSDMQSSLELSKEWHRPNSLSDSNEYSHSVNSILQATEYPWQRTKDNSSNPDKSSLERSEWKSAKHIQVTTIKSNRSTDANSSHVSGHFRRRRSKRGVLRMNFRTHDISRDQWYPDNGSGLRKNEHQWQSPCSNSGKSNKRTSVVSLQSQQDHQMQHSHLFNKRQTNWNLDHRNRQENIQQFPNSNYERRIRKSLQRNDTSFRGCASMQTTKESTRATLVQSQSKDILRSLSSFTDQITSTVNESRTVDIKRLCEKYPVNEIEFAQDNPMFCNGEVHLRRTTINASFQLNHRIRQSNYFTSIACDPPSSVLSETLSRTLNEFPNYLIRCQRQCKPMVSTAEFEVKSAQSKSLGNSKEQSSTKDAVTSPVNENPAVAFLKYEYPVSQGDSLQRNPKQSRRSHCWWRQPIRHRIKVARNTKFNFNIRLRQSSSIGSNTNVEENKIVSLPDKRFPSSKVHVASMGLVDMGIPNHNNELDDWPLQLKSKVENMMQHFDVYGSMRFYNIQSLDIVDKHREGTSRVIKKIGQ